MLARKLLPDGWQSVQGGLVTRHVQHIFEGGSQASTSLSEPDGVNMCADEVLISQFDSWRCHMAGDHQGGPAEEILVMGTAGCAVRKDKCRLTLSSSAATALCVVRRCWRDVPHVYSIELCDIDTKLHRRGTKENGQVTPPERVFPLLSDIIRDLRRVLP